MPRRHWVEVGRLKKARVSSADQGWAPGSPVQPPEKARIFSGKTGAFQPEPPGKFPVEPMKTETGKNGAF